MPDISIEQALYGSQDSGGYRFLAHSPGFLDEWLPEAQRLCTGFGERPTGVACPAAVFAQPFGKQHVAVVQVAECGVDDAGRPGALGFRLLVLSHEAYAFLGGDPFALAERFPPPWEARGELPALSCPAEPPPRRTVADIQALFERHKVIQPTLLGGVQALVDGGRVVFERSEPDPDMIRALWALLPWKTRAALWPASFAFGNRLGFDALVVPTVQGVEFADYLREEQAGDYPEGRYEHGLQVAAESGDQAELDALFARRSRAEVRRLGLLLLVAVIVLTVVMNWLSPNSPPPDAAPPAPAAMDLGPAKEFPATLNEDERKMLTPALAKLAEKVGAQTAPNATAEDLLQALDAKLGTPDRARDPGPLSEQGPPLRQLRVLLWKHDTPGYNDLGLNPKELVRKLEDRLAAALPGTARGG
ncbi:MAG TPA: hypothetical protein VKA46_29950 [Gemmataceae bacterium]|nr:hypothetical protein [Gemmataceae bacterium]